MPILTLLSTLCILGKLENSSAGIKGSYCCIISQLRLRAMQSEIFNVLTTIHSFSSKQWMTQRQCVYELSHWHNTRICVKRVKNSWMTISSVRMSYPAECNCHLCCERHLRVSHVFSCLFRQMYISQCVNSMSSVHLIPLVQHVLLSISQLNSLSLHLIRFRITQCILTWYHEPGKVQLEFGFGKI